MKKDTVVARDIGEFIASFPTVIQFVLNKLRSTIRKAAPKSVEGVKYVSRRSYRMVFTSFTSQLTKHILDFIQHHRGLLHSRMSYQSSKPKKERSNSPLTDHFRSRSEVRL